MPLLNRSGVAVRGVEYFVARSQVPRDVQLCAMRFRATAATRTNALIVPFPSDAPSAERADLVRVGDLKDGYGELFDDLAHCCLAGQLDDDDDHGDDKGENGNTSATAATAATNLNSARKVAVRVCADWQQLVEFREKGFRLSKTLKPLLQHYYSEGYAFVVCFLEFSPGVEELVELTFTFPISHESDDALFVPALTRPPPHPPSFTFIVYSVNTSRAAGVSTDEAARRLYRKLSAVLHIDAEHNALLGAVKRRELHTSLLPVRLVDIVELRRLRVRDKPRNEDLLLELDEATQLYFKAVRALKEPGGNTISHVERLLEKSLSHNAQHVAALALLANVLQQDDARTGEAEKQFRLLLRANPVCADSLQNFALFVETKMKDHDTAEVLYTRALTIEPTNARVLANFAVFLKNVRRDYDYADALYKRAIQTAPTSANTIGNYALFLSGVRNDVHKADQLYRLAIVLEERAASAAAAAAAAGEPSVGALVPPTMDINANGGGVFWKRRYEAFLEALQRTGRLQALLSSQLPPLAVPQTADTERLEKLDRKRTEEQRQRDQERAALERTSRRQQQRLPIVVVRCVRALVFGWRDVPRAEACVCLQRDDAHMPRLETDDDDDDDEDDAPTPEQTTATTTTTTTTTTAVACTCGGRAGEIIGSVLFRRTKDAVAEGTFARVLQSVQNDADAEPAVVDEDEDDFLRQAVGGATAASGASGARDCVVRTLNMLRGRETQLSQRCYDAMATLLTTALLAAHSVEQFAQCRDLMHMANTYRLEELSASSDVVGEPDASSLSSLTGSVESSEEDGGLRAPTPAAPPTAAAAAAAAAASPAARTNAYVKKREAALRTSRIVSAARSYTLLRVLRESAGVVWRDRAFWESALTDELRSQQLRQSSGSVVRHEAFDSSEALNETDAHTTALVLGQLASFATNMVHVDLDFAFIADFIDKQSVVFGIDETTRNELLQHAATASLLEMMQTSFGHS